MSRIPLEKNKKLSEQAFWLLLCMHSCCVFSLLFTFIFIYFSLFFIFIFWLCQVLVGACRIFFEACGIRSCSARAVRVFSLSSCCVQAPEHVGSVVCGTWALLLRCVSSIVAVAGLSCPVACGILVPWPEIELTSSALEGFFTTGPPGKSLVCYYWIILAMLKSYFNNHIINIIL